MITLPEPISANVYWRHRLGSFKPYPNPEADAYKLKVRVAINALDIQPLKGPLQAVVYYAASSVKRDTDNALKVLFDACQGLLYDNDNQIRAMLIMRCEAPKPKRDNACVMIEVKPLPDYWEKQTQDIMFGQ